ncbi:hypothetical protein [Actinokineospora bangkokensis]|uniref:Uncharacterized protein n=1 Tax=Actinokineospora bangkokensis TaxID=1193682 RepID=A0A1Q9LGB5_9PSEU|nr:hypothetical protein [Actinokineospora bangkokensis]OLR91082.1 hypothetical protein BJP25_31610 [Actinokineospora bangkokensis]
MHTPARAAAWHALDLAPDGLRTLSAFPLAALAPVAITTHDHRLATHVLTLCTHHTDHTAGLHLRATTLMLRATTAARTDPRTALEHLTTCGALLTAAGWDNPVLFPWRPWAARQHHALGDPGSARALADDDLDRARHWAAPTALGRALRVRAALAPPTEATDLLDEAITTLRPAHDPLGLALALLDRARAAGEGPTTGDHTREALTLAQACGADWLAARARRLGAPADHPPPRPATPPPLAS